MKTVNAEDLADKLDSILQDIDENPDEKYLVRNEGKPDMIIISMEEYDELFSLVTNHTK